MSECRERVWGISSLPIEMTRMPSLSGRVKEHNERRTRGAYRLGRRVW